MTEPHPFVVFHNPACMDVHSHVHQAGYLKRTVFLSWLPIRHSMKLIRLGIIAGLLLTFIFTIAYYPFMPAMVPSHWNAAGQANGYMSKFWGLFLIPGIMAGFVALFVMLPGLTP